MKLGQLLVKALVIAHTNLIAMLSKEQICREQFGDIAENCLERAELLGSLCLLRDYGIEARFEELSREAFWTKVYFFYKIPEASLSRDNITKERWKLLFNFVRNYLIKQGHFNMDLSLRTEEDDGKYSDEVQAYSDKYRKRFESIKKLAIWFENNLWRINNENIYRFLNSLSANLNPSGHYISFYELNDGDRNENYEHTVYAIIGTSCLILVVKEWGM